MRKRNYILSNCSKSNIHILNLINTFICIFILDHILCIFIQVYLYYLCLCTFVYGSICVPHICAYLHVKSVKVLCLSACASFLSTCLPLYNLTSTEKSDCGKINLLLSVIRIITVLVKLLQMILGYVTSFVGVSLSLSLCPYLQKICI